MPALTEYHFLSDLTDATILTFIHLLEVKVVMGTIRGALARFTPYLQLLYTPTHTHIPFGILDIFGAIRLSQIIDWIARGVFDTPTQVPGTVPKTSNTKRRDTPGKRATILQESFGLFLVLYGGETFLAICNRSTPSWVISPKIGLLFLLTHAVQTRTFVRRFIPRGPTLELELLLAVPDAIGRTLLLTRFTVLPLLHPKPGIPTLPPTPTTLILVPFIIASPFAALAFSGLNLFSPDPTLSIPLELRRQGWMMVDAWLPLVIPALFCSLIGPVEGWAMGFGWDEDEAVITCLGIVLVVFMGRAMYNFGYSSERWARILKRKAGKRKLKTA